MYRYCWVWTLGAEGLLTFVAHVKIFVAIIAIVNLIGIRPVFVAITVSR